MKKLGIILLFLVFGNTADAQVLREEKASEWVKVSGNATAPVRTVKRTPARKTRPKTFNITRKNTREVQQKEIQPVISRETEFHRTNAIVNRFSKD
jgi:ATP-dependent Clp protease ATP-binding subunit ClpA